MALSDSLFLFEIFLEELKSYVNTKQFIIKSQFANIFSVVLRDPAEVEQTQDKTLKIKKPKGKRGKGKSSLVELSNKAKSVLFTSNIDLLMSYMMQYPMEVSFWNKKEPEDKIGSTVIPWNPVFVEFLARLYKGEGPAPAQIADVHNVFDEITSKRMATIKLIIKLSHVKNNISQRFKSVAEKNTNTLVYSCFSNTSKTLNTAKRPLDDTGIIKTFYSGGRRKKKHSNKKTKKHQEPKGSSIEIIDTDVKEVQAKSLMDRSLATLIKSDTDINKKQQVNALQIQSCTYIKPLNVFGNELGLFGNRTYIVNYFTVASNPSQTSKQGKADSKHSSETVKSDGQIPKGSKKSSMKSDSPASNQSYKFQLCSDECPAQQKTPYAKSECSLDLPEEARKLISVKKCQDLKCAYRKERPPTNPRNDERMLDVSSIKHPCCVTTVQEQVVGTMKAHLKVGEDPCSCACECTFNIGRKTTYCQICGGYEVAGEDTADKPLYQMPPPCPIYHRMEKKKPASTSGSESRKKPERDRKKCKTRKIDDRFKFNYGYKGIPPQIGHSQCAFPCTGTMNNVPKSMGWLWTADNVPGLRFRPQWKPGAINKFVVRLLKQARNPGEVSKKRRKDTGRKKRPLKRPLLTVHKKDGEYSVTMETMKPYAKQRALNQAPYEDKEPLTYTIGRTEEENRERKKKKERAQRRLEREQREFIQSAFRDMCKDICLKTYQQALGILPHTETPDCTCYPALPGPELTNLNRSCSCSEDEASLASDTDSDEWIVEFTPPNAHFDPTYNRKKVFKNEAETQYTYLDYRVKLLDVHGNQVPRFFKSLDGKEQCSDLGGFWSPDHKWLEINVDGYIAPDGRWAPMIFFGPNGEHVDAETGRFQAMNGDWLVVGVDGYVDSQSKWKFYPKARQSKKATHARGGGAAKKGAGDKGDVLKSEKSWSCFGEVSAMELSKMGITGHGLDRRLLYNTLKDLVASGRNDVKLPDLVRDQRPKSSRKGRRTPRRLAEQVRCRHAVPSDKGILFDKTTRHKTYFKMSDWKNRRPRERMVDLERQGRSLSSFHKPCFHSFIDHETMLEHQRERLRRMAAGQGARAPVVSVAVQTVRI